MIPDQSIAAIKERCANGDGTYNGVAALAHITGIAYAEVEWSARRVQELANAGVAKPYILPIVRAERKQQPWK